MNEIIVTEEMLNGLRAKVSDMMSGKRLNHTYEVEKMAKRIAEIYAKDKVNLLRAAALLHDITKEKKLDEQVELCHRYGIEINEMDLLSPKTFHAKTASEMIKTDFPEFADPIIISAVRWHTTGHRGMTLYEKIIYLSDYIDESRKFDDCVELRNYFWGVDVAGMNEKERMDHLRDTLIISFNMTIKGLLEENSPIAKDTFDARNELICEKLKAN